jgi:hypothetical protein
MRVYYHPSVGEYARYDSFEMDYAALAGVPSGIATGIAGMALKRADREVALASIVGGGLMAGVFGKFYPKRILSWFNPPPFDEPIRYPRQIPKAVVTSFIGESGQVLNLLMHHGAGDVVIDYSPYRNNGKIYGASWVDGSWGWALGFDGVNGNVVVVPHSPSLSPLSSLTLGVWVCPDRSQPQTAGMLINKYYNYHLEILNDGHFRIFFYNGKEWQATTSPITIPDRTWSCIVAMFKPSGDDTLVELYLNGGLVISSVRTGRPVEYKGNLTIGSHDPSRPIDKRELYKGLIALPCIYNIYKGADFAKRYYEATKPLFYPQ